MSYTNEWDLLISVNNCSRKIKTFKLQGRCSLLLWDLKHLPQDMWVDFTINMFLASLAIHASRKGRPGPETLKYVDSRSKQDEVSSSMFVGNIPCLSSNYEVWSYKHFQFTGKLTGRPEQKGVTVIKVLMYKILKSGKLALRPATRTPSATKACVLIKKPHHLERLWERWSDLKKSGRALWNHIPLSS